MRTTSKLITFGVTALILTSASDPLNAQTTYQSNTAKTTIKGTSTLHDWDMTSSEGKTTASFLIEQGQVKGINALSFTMAAESLKSDRSGLDKNAYKALETDKYKDIVFKMTSGTVSSTGNHTFQVKATGNLTIAGTTKQTTITAKGQFNPSDKSISVTGNTAFKMTTYNVKPPTVMMGTIKTGDDITIDYQAKFTAR